MTKDRGAFEGRKLAGYEILSLLGAGAMGEVYRARDVKLGREVALKILARSAAGGPAYLQRFEEEARLASVLNHPNIVTIYGVGDEADIAYIAMELVRGRTLREVFAGHALRVGEILNIAAPLADALAAAHASGIVHRDLKPENVMVTSDGLVKVLDSAWRSDRWESPRLT
jgi:eukaryotic-like serine/threonine-protein kinase